MFKKASNMNNALSLSLRVDEEFQRLAVERSPNIDNERQNLSFAYNQQLYRQAMAAALEKDKVGNWAGGNIHIGDLILLVDSDTRVVR